MASYSQTNRPLQVTTPLGGTALLITGFRGAEQISHLFSFTLDLIADNATTVDFGSLIGKQFTVSAATPGKSGDTEWRYLDGICAAFSEGNRNKAFTSFSAEIVPKMWLLTRQARSRIFQQVSVPDILKQVFQGYDCDYELRGKYEPREYCVQYRETDFNFASRLMEDEGIYYFFKHSKSGHTMVIADTSQSHADVPGLTSARYEMIEGGPRKADHVYEWRKTQAVRAAKYTLWDRSFQQPTQNLEAKENIQNSVQVGTATHTLKDQVNGSLEIYDFPGGYAERFDGVSPSGGDQASRLQKIFDDNRRTVKLRMEAEAVPALTVQGSSSCVNFVSGHKFSLSRHYDGEGSYVLVSVTHDAAMIDSYRSGGAGGGLEYTNRFTCIPFQLPYRPERKSAVPFIAGVQTALVTGPSGKEIFIDKYGRVKVQFYWDREGKNDGNSSCWIRVGQAFAGKRWGASFWPRIGQEVLVAFLEGDPDQPVIVGSVYNAEQMPPYEGDGLDSKHKSDPNVSGIKTNSTLGGTGYNEIRFDDTKDKEQLFFHAERNLEITTKNDSLARTFGSRHQFIGKEDDGKSGDQMERVCEDHHLTIDRDQIAQIGRNQQLHIGGIDGGTGNQDIVVDGTRKESVGQDLHLTVSMNRQEKVGQNSSLTVGMDLQEKAGMKYAMEAGTEIHLKAGMTLVLEAGMQLTLKVGGNFIDISPVGVAIQGTMVMINSGGAAGSGSGSSPTSPQSPQQANPTQPTVADDSKSGQKSARS